MANANELPEELAPSEIRYESGGAIEEVFNSITHAIGAGLSIAGLVALIMLTNQDPDPWKYVSFSVYGASQIMLFLSSALLHSFASLPRIRYYLRIIDTAFIYVLIAGTYTPLGLVAMRDSVGWIVFGIIWGLAIVGIVMKSVVVKDRHIITDLLYVPMGWLILPFFRPILESTTTGFVVWALIGGICYTVGVGFYAWKKLPFSHTIWHLFVIAGSFSFFMAYSVHLA
jgi:hemolysin III